MGESALTLPRPQGLLDLLILFFIAWGLAAGFRMGLARAATSLVGLVAGWAVAALFTGQALSLADARWDVVGSLAASLEQVLPDPGGAIPVVDLYRERLSGPAQAGEPLPRLLAWGIASALTFLLLFTVTRLFFALLGRLLHIAFDAAPLRPLNRLAGAGFGALRNILIAALALGLLVPAAVIGPLSWLPGLVEASAYAPRLLQVFYMVNPWILGEPPGTGLLE